MEQLVPLLTLLLIGSVAAGAASAYKARSFGPLLVLTEFNVDASSRTVRIVGRAPGIVAFVLASLGLDTKTTLYASEAEVHFKTASLSGEQIRSTPITQIASIGVGYSKPILLLILGAAFGFFGLVAAVKAGIGAFVAGALVGAIFVVAYALLKEITISVETTGSLTFGVRFRRSVIENVDVDIDKAKTAMELIARNVVLSQGKVAAGPGTMHAPTPHAPIA